MNKETNIKAVIFDMGGVFIRTSDLSGRQQLAEKYGMTVKELTDAVFNGPVSVRAEVGENNREEFWGELMKQFDEEAEMATEFADIFFNGDIEDKELVALAWELKKKYKIGLLSNAYLGTREWMEERHTFLDLFDPGMSFFSAEEGMRKPDHRFFQLVLDALQVEANQAVFIDDFKVNIDAAKELGIHTVWYRNPQEAQQKLRKMLLKEDE